MISLFFFLFIIFHLETATICNISVSNPSAGTLQFYPSLDDALNTELISFANRQNLLIYIDYFCDELSLTGFRNLTNVDLIIQ